MPDRGFTLVEVLVALGILVVAALATAQMMSAAALAIHQSRVSTVTSALAVQRMEQLLALDWSSLTPTPADTLDRDVDGCVEFLDGEGAVLGVSGAAPAGTVFVRRWAIDLPDGGVSDARVLRVLVRLLAADRAGARAARGDTRLLTLRARLEP